MDAIAQLDSALADRYAIDREIGRGGMATVYLARDLKHHRPVAFKVLDPELGAVLGVERFLSEIRVTANLQHPNLLPLFDSGEAGGLLFYVMPFVEGESLRARLDREKQLPVDDAIHIAVAVANALAYAHQHGVIHRDLKPENILLQHGQPVVADFGIALAVSNAGGPRVTQTGLSLGTPQYMSPEQATGDRNIDGRTDIYSLGAVTYEMLAGEPPHSGTSAQAIIAKLMTEEPRPIGVLRRSVAPHVEATVRRALEKLPADRFATAAQFADAIQGKGGIVETRPVASTPTRMSARTRALVAGSVAVATLAVAAAGAAWWRLAHPAPGARARFELGLPAGQMLEDLRGLSVAISRDGQVLAYLVRTAGQRVIAVRKLDELAPRLLANTDGAADIRFSPDGKWISYNSLGTGFMKVPVEGGQPVRIAPTSQWTGGGWTGERPTIVDANRIVSMSPDGGSVKVLATTVTPNNTLFSINDPFVLQGQRVVTFRATDERGEHLALVSVDSGPIVVSDLPVLNVLGVVDGWLLFGRRQGDVAAARVDLRTGKIDGDVVPLLAGVRQKVAGGLSASLALQGNLVYISDSAAGDASSTGALLSMLDEHGVRVWTAPERRNYRFPVWSPDGKRIAVDVFESSQTGVGSDIWVYNVETKILSRVTTHGGTRPAWSPDGKRIAFVKDYGNTMEISWVSVDGNGTEEVLAKGQRFREVEFSPDGRFLLSRTENNSDTKSDLWVVDLKGDRTAKPLLATPFNELMVSVSPDSRWFAYQSDETGRNEIYVRPLGRDGGRVPISASGGTQPRWARAGNRIIYRDGAGRYMAAKLTMSDQSVAVTARDSLFADGQRGSFTSRQSYDMHPDGKRFVTLADETTQGSVVVILNWLDEVRRKLASSR